RPADAAQAARARLPLWPRDGERLYGVASELALAAGVPEAAQNSEPAGATNAAENTTSASGEPIASSNISAEPADSLRNKLLVEALDVLRQAVEAGLKNEMRALTDPAWAACPNRDDLQRVLQLDPTRATTKTLHPASRVMAK
ncbi:MAG TPA: hypothetical protein VGE52_22075, partial [Pirellulales bacterium]